MERQVTGRAPARRRYAGQDAAQRREERRERLLVAGVEVFGDTGYPASTVKQVCRQAQLTERYFYESFRDREDLLAAVYDEQVEQVRTATFAAMAEAGSVLDEQIKAGVGAFVRVLVADPRRARVILVEVVGVSPRLEVRRRAVIHEFAEVVVGAAVAQGHPVDESRMAMAALLLVGGVNELLVDRTLGRLDSSVEDVVALCADIFIAAYETLVGPLR